MDIILTGIYIHTLAKNSDYIIDRTPGHTLAFHRMPGTTYLFFLRPMHTGLKNLRIAEPWGVTYDGPSFGRFLIEGNGRLQIVAAFWTCPECGASKALAGKTLAEAETTLRPLIEQVALESTPTPTPQPSTPTPTPTPQLGTPTPVSQLDTPTPISP